MNRTIRITFITPCFCRGADCSENGAPEIRPPSIRGQLHWWFRALGGTPQDENAIFGNVHGGMTASPLVVRVKHDGLLEAKSTPTLPHKNGGLAAPKLALPAGTKFDLLLSTRLRGLASALEAGFTRALEAWLHLGALGLRATRGGGNFTWDGQPGGQNYVNAIAQITRDTALRATLLDKDYDTAEKARRDITDTLAHAAFSQTRFPLGAVKQGFRDQSGAPSRKTSPLRFRVVQFAAGHFRIAAIWDGRRQVTGNTDDDLRAAIRLLGEKPIGRQLAQSSLA
jgi:hypothetical protein